MPGLLVQRNGAVTMSWRIVAEDRMALRRALLPAALAAFTVGLGWLVPEPQAALAVSQGAARSRQELRKHAPSKAVRPTAGATMLKAHWATAGPATPASRWPWIPAACWPARPSPRSRSVPSTHARWTVPEPRTAGATTHSGSSATAAPSTPAVPVAVDTSGVLAGKTLTQITAGDNHMCALDSAGAAYCWGHNSDGELGDGSTADSSVPVAVDTSGVLAGKTLTQITAGSDHTCALDSTGAAYCWGDNVQWRTRRRQHG